MAWMWKIWEACSEYVSLFFVNLGFTCFSFFEFIKVAARFYGNRRFRQWDLALLRSYLFQNPYRISKRYLLEMGAENPYLYGETPLTAMEKIAKRFHFSASDLIYELGCGRGRTCFWLAAFIKCPVVGIELVPTFVEKAQAIKERYQIPNVNFICRDVLDVDYSIATCVYFFGTSCEPDFLDLLIGKLSQLPQGAKIVTVSFPLREYTDKPLFHVVDRFSLSFGWGEVDVYLQLRT